LPATNPQVLIYVVVDSAQGGDVWGSTVAAPIFYAVASQIASILNLIPDKHT
jgi:cell division protein FtsI/penicillin-binding protein 2